MPPDRTIPSNEEPRLFLFILPSPHTLHPTPYTLHPTPHTLHPTPQFTPRCDSQILLKVSEIVAISVLPSQIILNIPPRRLTFE